MFQNIQQLHSAMKEILSMIQRGEDLSNIFPQYKGIELDMVEAINACLAEGYLTGVSCKVGAKSDVTVSLPAPHVTSSGMAFISEN